jgi:hypothetical protein
MSTPRSIIENDPALLSTAYPSMHDFSRRYGALCHDHCNHKPDEAQCRQLAKGRHATLKVKNPGTLLDVLHLTQRELYAEFV